MDVHDASMPWSWRLDPHSGSSASLGPSTSASHTSTNPLSSLAHPSTGSTADGVFWQDFRPVSKRHSGRDRKKARLHRFDSDEEERDSETANQHKGEGDAEAGSEDEDANGLGHTSSEGSDTECEDDVKANAQSNHLAGGNEEQKDQTQAADDENAKKADGVSSSSPTRSSSKRRRVESPATSTQLLAQAIHHHALLSNADTTARLQCDAAPAPLTYKETVRLVRLIAMIFRFPKPPRRIVRRRQSSAEDLTATQSDSPSAAPTPSASTTSLCGETSLTELKPKYLLSSSTSSTSRKPRMLAKVHPDDARLDSAAVLKLIALLPAALPSRVSCADWIVGLAVRSRRDEHGNILLSDSAYLTARQMEQGGRNAKHVEGLEREDTTEEEGRDVKVTRSMRQRLGTDLPPIPLPKFWLKKQSPQIGDDSQASHPGGLVPIPSSAEEAEVDALTPTAPRHIPPPLAPTLDTEAAEASLQSDLTITPSSPPAESDEPQEFHSQPRKGSDVVNLSKVLAERMRGKRHAKTLLLRTHQSLRKRRSTEDGGGADESSHNGEGARPAKRAASKEEEEEQDADGSMDAETLANTVANSGAITTGVLGEQGCETASHRDATTEGLVS